MQGLHPQPTVVTRFSIEELRVQRGMLESEQKKRRKAVLINFGWTSVERLELEFNWSLARYYRSYMSYSSYLDLSRVVTDLVENGLKPTNGYPEQRGQELLSPLDVFALPFRHLTRGSSLRELACDYGISLSQIALYLHNAVVLVTLFWAPYYLHFRHSPSDWARFCSPTLASLLRCAPADVFHFLADNVEMMSLSSGNLLLQLYLFSQKLGHAHTVKQLLVCFPAGLIAYRAPLYGGNVTEIEAMEKFIVSPQMENLKTKVASDHIVGITDSGFSRLSSSARKEIELVLPTSGMSGQQASAPQLAWRQVRCFLLALCLNPPIASLW